MTIPSVRLAPPSLENLENGVESQKTLPKEAKSALPALP